MNTDVKVIAIKLPFDLQERILSFPFLHALREHYPESELHFITPRRNIEVLNLLPFTAYYHEFDDDEINSIFDVHRYCVNAKIYNVDLFISLTNSLPDACLGIGFRAKLRLGFSDGWKTLVLNQKVPRPVGHHVTEDFFALYKEHVGEEVGRKLKVISRDLPQIFIGGDDLPYIAVNLSPMRGANIDDEWIELLSHFEGIKIVLFSSEEQEKVQLHMDTFLSKLPKKNIYVNYVYPDLIEMVKMIANSRGLITYSGAAAALSSYVGSKTVILYEQEDPQRTGPLYFLADTMFLTQPRTSAGPGLNKRSPFNMEDVAEKAHGFFKLPNP